MAIARQCDLCQRFESVHEIPNPLGIEWPKYLEQFPYCDKCSRLIEKHSNEAYERLKASCEVALKSVSAIALLRYVATEKPDEFRDAFGSYAADNLTLVVKELEEVASRAVKASADQS